MSLRIHAICLALNEEVFIETCLKSIYDYCSGISVITQYDRDYYGNNVVPDTTASKVLNYPDPAGKIHIVTRRYKDETVARNHEMQSLMCKPYRGVKSHGVAISEIQEFHSRPDYFLIIDADEIYDESLPSIIQYLERKRPRGMRVSAYQYGFTWNQRIPIERWSHHHFGFIKAGIMFEMRRKVSWNEQRIQSICSRLNLPDLSKLIYRFIDCPIEVGVFHHACYIGGKARLMEKFKKHSHQEVNKSGYIDSIMSRDFEEVSSNELPEVVRQAKWPIGFIN